MIKIILTLLILNNIRIINMGINPECWLLCVRITNVFTVGIMLAFQIWYIIELFDREYSAIITVMRMWLPCFIMWLLGYLDCSLSLSSVRSSNCRRLWSILSFCSLCPDCQPSIFCIFHLISAWPLFSHLSSAPMTKRNSPLT